MNKLSVGLIVGHEKSTLREVRPSGNGKRIISAATAWLDGSPRFSLGLSLSVLATAETIHHLSGHKCNLDFFYVVAVAIAARFCGRRTGILVSMLSAIVWFAEDYQTGMHTSSRLGTSLMNTFYCFAVYLSVALLVSRLQAALLHAKALSAVKSDMLSAVSHHFNNALTSMGLAVRLLEEKAGDALEGRETELYDILNRNLVVLKATVRNFLEDARMTSGHMALDIQPTDVSSLARNVVKTLEPLASQKSIHIYCDLPVAGDVVMADSGALNLVLTNLISNAIKYTPDHGRVTLRLVPEDKSPSRLVISVEDTGIGMSREEQRQALSGFVRTARGKRMAPGYGLGLTVTQELLEGHGSRLLVESNRGKGSTLSFQLSAAEKPLSHKGGSL